MNRTRLLCHTRKENSPGWRRSSQPNSRRSRATPTPLRHVPERVSVSACKGHESSCPTTALSQAEVISSFSVHDAEGSDHRDDPTDVTDPDEDDVAKAEARAEAARARILKLRGAAETGDADDADDESVSPDVEQRSAKSARARLRLPRRPRRPRRPARVAATPRAENNCCRRRHRARLRFPWRDRLHAVAAPHRGA